MMIANTWFKKRDSHLITYRSGSNFSQIDFILTQKVDQKYCKDCKVIPRESVATQHRLVVLDTCIRSWKKKEKTTREPRIKWWNLRGDNQTLLKEKLLKEANWELVDDSNSMWNGMASCITKIAKEVLGESRSSGPKGKET